MQVEISYGPCGQPWCNTVYAYAVWTDPVTQYWAKQYLSRDVGVSLLELIEAFAADAPKMRRVLDAMPLGLMMSGNDLQH